MKIFTICILALSIAFTAKLNHWFEKTPEVNDVWRYHPPSPNEDPFYNGILKKYYDYKVIDVKNGYIQYMDLEDSSIESSTLRMFYCNSECINCK